MFLFLADLLVLDQCRAAAIGNFSHFPFGWRGFTVFARRGTVLFAKRTAKGGGIVKPPLEQDIRDRFLGVKGAQKIHTAAFESAELDIVAEALILGFKQLLQVAHGNAMFLRDLLQVEIRIAEAHFYGLKHAFEQHGPSAGRTAQCFNRRVFHQGCEDEFRQAQLNWPDLVDIQIVDCVRD